MSSKDLPYENELYSRLIESLDAIDASFKAMEERILKLEKEEDWSDLPGMESPKSTSLLLVDDGGVEHLIPRVEFTHLALITKEPPHGIGPKSLPLPLSGYPCLRAFDATFPGVCIDFRAKGSLPLELLRKYKSAEAPGMLTADKFLRALMHILPSGNLQKLAAVSFGDKAQLKIEINTYQY